MYLVYILLSQRNPRKYYIGITTDLNSRLKEHNSCKTNYARRHAPWKEETVIAFRSKKLAYAFEKYLKAGSGHAFLKKTGFAIRLGLLEIPLEPPLSQVSATEQAVEAYLLA